MSNPRSLAARAFSNPKISGGEDLDTPAYRAAELPACTGVGTARAIARAYGSLATGGAELGMKPETLAALHRPEPAPSGGPHDLVLRIDTAFSCGFLKPCQMSRLGGSDRSFGTPGAGGSLGFADPDLGLGFAYVMNRMGFHVADDPREKVLRDAVYACVRRRG
jgi:CubicO group peptidase (beta-lactamase class C family)